MKRILFFFIILFSVTMFASLFSSPAEAKKLTPTPVPTRVEYALPYPGILPDNPLYFLKNLRDKIIEMLISNPVNKAEFYILQADKKLNMGISLSSVGKTEETREILSQALTARTHAVTTITDAIQSGSKIPAFVLEKLVLSLTKHKEVLNDLKLSVNTVDTLLVKAQQMLQNSK